MPRQCAWRREMNVILMVLTSSGGTALLIKLIDILQDKFSEKRRKEKEAVQELFKKVDSQNFEQAKDIKALSNGLNAVRQDFLVLMHDRIFNIFKEVSQQEKISISEKSNLDYMYERYVDETMKKGNHDAENYYKLIEKMKVVPDKD